MDAIRAGRLARALRRRWRRRRSGPADPMHAIGQWSDADLLRAWHRSTAELSACRGRSAGRVLTVVMWRAVMLDELDLRELTIPVR